MNAQELYLDSVSGRFMDGVSPKPIENPTFFSNEKRYVKCNVLKVRGSEAIPRQRAKNSNYFMRIGTSGNKLADGIDPTTAPPQLITAEAIVVTAAPISAKGSASVITYNPVTALFTATVSTISRVSANVECKISYIPPVTASINATISTATFSTQTFKKTIQTSYEVPGPQLIGHPAIGNFYFTPAVLTFTPIFTKPIQAQFSCQIFPNGRIRSIAVTCRGASYPAGTYALSIETAVTPTTEAVAQVSVDDLGVVGNVTFTEYGLGYTSAPTVSLFKPEASIIGVKTSKSCAEITPKTLKTKQNSGSSTSAGLDLISCTETFRWTLGQTSTTPASATIIFSQPDATSTTVAVSAPSASIEFVKNEYKTGQYYGIWKINWNGNGYGYNSAPSSSHSAITVSNCKISRYYAKTNPPKGFTTETTKVREGQIVTSQIPVIPAETIFYINGEEVTIEEINKIRSGISNLNQISVGRAYYTDAFLKQSESDKVSVSRRFVDTRFGATIEQDGLGLILYDFEAVGTLEQTKEQDSGDKNILGFTADLQNALGSQTDNWSQANLQGMLNEILNLAGSESLFSKRVEYLTVNADIPDQGRQLLAVITTPEKSSEKTISSNNATSVFVGNENKYYKGRISIPLTFGLVANKEILFDGSGVWDAEFSVLDFGVGYSELPSGISRLDIPGKAITSAVRSFNPIKGLVNNPLFNSSMTIGITIPTGTSFKKTVLSREASTGQRFSAGGIQHFISDPGFGYTDDIVVDVVVTAPVTFGIVTSVTLSNIPSAYLDGIYDCEVQSPPTGTSAKVKILFDSSKKINGGLFIENSGMGYTSAPIITAPTPNLRNNGFLSSIQITNKPSGYFYNSKEYDLIVGQSGQQGGGASAKMRFYKTKKITSLFSLNPSADKKYQTPTYTQSDLYKQFSSYNLDALALKQSSFPARIVLDPAGGGQIESFFENNISPGDNSRIFSAKQIYFGKYKNAKVRLNLGTKTKGYVPVAIFNESGDPELSNLIKAFPIENVSIAIPSYEELSQGFVFTVYADLLIKIEEIEYADVYITDSGFGYSTAPVITAPSPDSSDYGSVLKISCTNNPVGYVSNYNYNLSLSSSPSAGGDATAQFTISTGGAVSTTVLNFGFGYTTPPSIVAQPPNAVQGFISNIVVSSLGSGYSPGEYDCIVTTAPAGGNTAEAKFSLNANGTGQFIITNSGSGYVTAPNITAATPSGNVVFGITITCQGSYYDNDDARFVLSDSSGDGCILGSPVISAGKILSVPIVNGGFGYLNPAIRFDAPAAPILSPLELSEVEGEFTITTASANQILGNLDSRQISLEVYESDGSSQQVVALGSVNLVKRIPS